MQAWWDVHAYYPRHASQADEGGTVKVHLVIYADGRVWRVEVAESSASPSLDTAAVVAFRGVFVRPFAPGTPDTTVDLTLHYVVAHRHEGAVAAGYTPAASKRPFTITNQPVTSPILETILQRTCSGEVVKEGIRNHPAYGGHHWAQAVFFRRPEDGTPWVKYYDGGQALIAPVNELGKMVQWTGPQEYPRKGASWYYFAYHFTVWPDGENKLTAKIEAYVYGGGTDGINTGGTVDFTCATEVVPPIPWRASSVQTYQAPSDDPP